MPLSQIFNISDATIFIWKITENIQELQQNLLLQSTEKERLITLKKEKNQLCFLAVRQLLKEANINNLFYNLEGKPFLTDKFISISHCFPYAVIVVSGSKSGIDIERKQEKIVKIAPKFTTNFSEEISEENITKLTKIWTSKEAIYKAFGMRGIDLKKNILLENFNNKNSSTKAEINFLGKKEKYSVFWEELSDFILCLALKSI